MINIFVGNLDTTCTETQLRDLFAAYGGVQTVNIVMNRDTAEPRGFAFVEMTQAADAEAAVAALNGTELQGRTIRVNEARPKLAANSNQDTGGRDHRRHKI